MSQRVAGAILAAVVALLAAGCSDDDETTTGSGPGPWAELLPARKSCGHFRIAPPGDYPLIGVEVVKGRVPCRVARRVLMTQYREGSPEDAIEAAAPWRCVGPEGLVECHKNPGGRSAGDQGTLP